MALVASSQPNKALKIFSSKLHKIRARPLDFLVQNVGPFTTHKCEMFLINLKELVEKKKRKGEVAEKVQRNCKVCCIGCVSSFSGPLQLIFIA